MSVEAINNCRYCLMCRHVAPVGHVTRDETLTPHGIALVVASEQRGLLEWDDSSISVLYAEPDTGHCRAYCVTDQRLPAAVAEIRARVCEAGLAPNVVYDVHTRLERNGSAFGKRITCSGKTETALFVGDEAHHLWPDCVGSAQTLLQSCSVEALPIGTGAATGYLAGSLGFPHTARAQAQSCIDEIRACGASRILVLAPKDLFTFRQLWPERLGISWPQDIEMIDFAAFLAAQLTAGTLRLDTGYNDAAYVDPTHAMRVQDRCAPVRTLCKQVLGQVPRELFWRKERAHPVGSTALQFSRPDIAEALTRARLEDALQTGANTLLCDDPGTAFHLARYAHEYGLTVAGLYEELAALT